MLLDQRFLTIHPATSAWWDQREKCESCRWLNLREGTEGEGVMRCTAVRVDQRATRDLLGAYCIDVRSESGLCGPDAKLYQSRTTP